jgi:hypothetical protein
MCILQVAQLVSHSTRADQRPVVNQWGQQLAAATRAIGNPMLHLLFMYVKSNLRTLYVCVGGVGPLLGGSLWAWSVDMPFDAHAYLAFFLMSTIQLIGVIYAFRVPLRLNQPHPSTWPHQYHAAQQQQQQQQQYQQAPSHQQKAVAKNYWSTSE